MKNEGGFLSLEQFQDKYGIISNFLEYNGLLKAIPMKFKEVIAVNNKLEKVCDRYVTVLNNKYFKAYKAFLQDDGRKT